MTNQTKAKELLESMISALDQDNSDAYWSAFEEFLALHQNLIEEALNAQIAARSAKSDKE